MWWDSNGIAGWAIAVIFIGCILVAVVVDAIIDFSAEPSTAVVAAGTGAVASVNASTTQDGLSNNGGKCLTTDKMGFSI